MLGYPVFTLVQEVGMNSVLRVALVVSALLVLGFVTRKIRKAQFNTKDSLFWLFLSICLVFVAIFPGVAFFFSDILGIQSPSNFIFLTVIALLLIREFTIQAQLSQLRRQTAVLSQEIALREALKEPKTDYSSETHLTHVSRNANESES